MKPKLWDGPNVIGEAQVRYMQTTDMPFQTISGPGFSAHKKGEFAEVYGEGHEPDSPTEIDLLSMYEYQVGDGGSGWATSPAVCTRDSAGGRSREDVTFTQTGLPSLNSLLSVTHNPDTLVHVGDGWVGTIMKDVPPGAEDFYQDSVTYPVLLNKNKPDEIYSWSDGATASRHYYDFGVKYHRGEFDYQPENVNLAYSWLWNVVPLGAQGGRQKCLFFRAIGNQLTGQLSADTPPLVLVIDLTDGTPTDKSAAFPVDGNYTLGPARYKLYDTKPEGVTEDAHGIYGAVPNYSYAVKLLTIADGHVVIIAWQRPLTPRLNARYVVYETKDFCESWTVTPFDHLNTKIRTVSGSDIYPFGAEMNAIDCKLYNEVGEDENYEWLLEDPGPSWPPYPWEGAMHAAFAGDVAKGDKTWVLTAIRDEADTTETQFPWYEVLISDSDGQNLSKLQVQPPFGDFGDEVGPSKRRNFSSILSLGRGHMFALMYEWDSYSVIVQPNNLPTTDADGYYPSRIVAVYSVDRGESWTTVPDILGVLKASVRGVDGPRDFAADSALPLIENESTGYVYDAFTYNNPTYRITPVSEFRSENSPGMLLMTFTNFAEDRIEGYYVDGLFSKARYRVLWRNNKDRDICPVQNFSNPDRTGRIGRVGAVYCGSSVHPFIRT